jgi:hypothetical protein
LLFVILNITNAMQLNYKYEIKKWGSAFWRTATLSESGRLLWVAAFGLFVCVGASAACFQWAQVELATVISNYTSALAFVPNVGERSNSNSHLKHPIWTSAAFYSIAALAILTVSGSVLAAFMVTLVSKAKVEASMLDRTNVFLLLAGTLKKTPNFLNASIDIVVPTYKYVGSPLPPGKPEQRSLYIEVGGVTRKVAEGAPCVHEQDTEAAIMIGKTLRDLGFNNVMMVKDSDIEAISQRRAQCRFLIGLRTNSGVRKILDEPNPARLFDIRDEHGLIHGAGEGNMEKRAISLAITDQHGIAHGAPVKGKEFQNFNTSEVLFIGKACNSGIVTIIIGGLSAWGTRRCAEYFCSSFDKIKAFRDESSQKSVEGREFAAVLTVNFDKPTVATIQEIRVP